MINVPMTGCHVFSLIWTIFKLVRDINKTNVLTIFHDDWANIVTSRVLTRKTTPPTGGHSVHIFSIYTYREKCPPTGGHVFDRSGPFKFVRDINKTNALTNFHDDLAKIVTSRVLTRKTARPLAVFDMNVTSTVFTRFFFFLPNIIGTNLLTKFHEDRTINVASRTDDGRTTDKDPGEREIEREKRKRDRKREREKEIERERERKRERKRRGERERETERGNFFISEARSEQTFQRTIIPC
ncbi:hypothetical protein DPMN_006005 [Dreissena polymorpha]|uniref:Uncharacterized protein n=1 Tax=Dreissena polymorpha TaxID=45954 RepID=A0A9D4RV13_DREPO|nr:hypothetical protein DPMN_006005 [Dreissena polymorpha]